MSGLESRWFWYGEVGFLLVGLVGNWERDVVFFS